MDRAVQALEYRKKDIPAARQRPAYFVICRELKGLGTGKVLWECNGCVEDAARMLMEEFGE